MPSAITKKEKSYKTEIRDFMEAGDCDPESVAASPVIPVLAEKYGKTVRQVALDINRLYTQSWKPLRSGQINLLDD
jgi:hypothetical protein